MNVIESKIYICLICKKFSYDKNIAKKCCEIKYCGCGEKLTVYSTRCIKCTEKLRDEEANKIDYSDYTGTMFYDKNSDSYFSDREEMLDYYTSEDITNIPFFVYACHEIYFKVNIDNAIESACDKMHYEFDEIKDEQELIDFVREWNENQTGISYYPDYKNIVVFR